MNRHARPVLARLERTPAVRQRLGQHGHHPVREVDRVAALDRLGVQRVAGPHIPGDIGDRDDGMPARTIAFGEHGVVEVARILAVDGHQRQLAQVGAPIERRGHGGLGLGEGVGGNT